ncbi:hypothetical protein C8R31_105105 [Nitrosospira sp. Nsp2]|nr:hypothetical protein C8R31_105105 [Nitrosospira sp. Nsp2]
MTEDGICTNIQATHPHTHCEPPDPPLEMPNRYQFCNL